MNKKQINELRNGLEKITKRLNNKLKEKKELWRKCCAGKEFLFRTEENPFLTFQIYTEYSNGERRMYANIKTNRKSLEGYIIPIKEYAGFICTYLRNFSNKYSISLKNLSNFSEVL